MEETRLCKLIAAMRDRKWELHEIFKGQGSERMAYGYSHEHTMLDEVYRILTDSTFAEEIAELYDI